MTTIIADLRPKHPIMLADNQTSVSTGAVHCEKIYRIEEGPNEGHIVGTTGCVGPCLLFLHWYAKKATRDWGDVLTESGMDIDANDEDFECIILRKDGIFLVDRFFVPYILNARYWAVGSGGPLALGAMDANASADKALTIACYRDPFTAKMGRPAQLMTLW